MSTAGASWTNATLPSAWLASGLKIRDGVLEMIPSSSAGLRNGFSDRIRAAMPAMIGAALRTLDRWHALPSGVEIDIAHEMMRTTFDIILNTMLPGRGSIDAELMERSVTSYLESTSWIVALAMIGAPRWVPYLACIERNESSASAFT